MRLKLYRGKWAAVFTENGRIKRVSLRTDNREVAERRLKDLASKPIGDLVSDIFDAYITEKEAQKKRSIGSIKTCWRALKPYFGHLRPDQIDRPLCRSYAAKRIAGGVLPGTVIKDLGSLKAAMRWAGKPVVIEMPAAPAPRDRHLSRAEFAALLKATKPPHLRLFVTLALATGARAGALFDLKWERIDLGRGLIALGAGSGNKRRATVPMTKQARTALEEAYKARTCDYVIEWGGHPVKSLKRSFAEACKTAGLGTDVTPHVLRHTAAVWMAEGGVPMEEIAQFLGHADAKVTYRVYARFSPEYLRRAAKALE